MLKYFVRKAIKAGSFTRPRIVICIPSGVIAQHDALTAHINERVGRAEVDADIFDRC